MREETADVDIEHFDIQLCFLTAWRFVLAWPPKAQAVFVAGSMAHGFVWVSAGLLTSRGRPSGMY